MPDNDYARPCILTKFRGANENQGARITASFGHNRVTLSWDSALEAYENHKRVAQSLAHSMGWDITQLIGAHMRDSKDTTVGYVFVLLTNS